MEAKNTMVSPENPRGIFGVSIPKQPKQKETPDLTPVLNPDERKLPLEFPKKSLIRRLAANLAIRALVSLGALATVGYAIYEIPPVNTAIHNLIGAETVSPIFDNSMDKQTAVVGINAVPASQEQLDAFMNGDPMPTIPEGAAQPELNVMFSGSLQKGDSVQIEKNRVDQVFSPLTQKPETVIMSSFLTFPRAGIDVSPSMIQGINNAKSIELFQAEPFIKDGQQYLSAMVLRVEMPDGIRYQIGVRGVDDIRDISLLRNLTEVPILTNDQTRWNQEKQADIHGIPVDAKENTFRTTREGSKVSIVINYFQQGTDRGVPVKQIYEVDQNNQLTFSTNTQQAP